MIRRNGKLVTVFECTDNGKNAMERSQQTVLVSIECRDKSARNLRLQTDEYQ